MGANGKQEFRDAEHSASAESFAKWILGAVGLAWVLRLAARASRRHRPSAAEVNRLHRYRRLAVDYSGSSALFQHSPKPHRGHEQRDASTKWIFGIVLFLIVSVVAIQVILGGYLSLLKKKAPTTDNWRPVTSPRPPSASVPSGPRLQISPPADLQAFRHREEAELHSYAWMNKTAGVVRIPIDQAMELVLHQGLPTRSRPDQNQVGPSSYDLMQQRAVHREPEIQGEK